MMAAVHVTAMASRDNEAFVCSAFSSNIFKPAYCGLCYKAKSAHTISAMPLQNLSNGLVSGNRGGSGDADIWVEKKTNDQGKQMDPQAHDSRSTQNGTGHHCANKHSSKLERRGSPTKQATQNGIANEGVASLNKGTGKGPYNPNLYEAIYPNDRNVGSCDNQANVILESPRGKQRSYSDVRAPPHIKGDNSRRISTPSPCMGVNNNPEGSISNVFEFQKLAGRLKHTNRKDPVDPASSPHTGSQIPSLDKRKMLASKYGYAQVNKIGKRNVEKKNSAPHQRSQSASNLSASNVQNRGGQNPRNVNHRNDKNGTISSSCSLGELPSRKGSRSSVDTEEVAPTVPVRSESMKKETSKGPGFALDCLVPDRITIISADGSKKVVTSKGQCHTTTAAPLQTEAASGHAVPSHPSKAVVRSKSSPQIILPNETPTPRPVNGSSKPVTPSEPQPDSIPYETMRAGPIISPNDNTAFGVHTLANRPLPECPGQETVTGQSTQHGLPSQKEPPKSDRTVESSASPIILHNEQDHRTKNRHSGNYKVPIFIKHQDYDNLGTVLADQDYEAMQLRKLSSSDGNDPATPGTENGLLEDQYYLNPNAKDGTFPKERSLQHAEHVVQEDEYEVVHHSQTPPVEDEQASGTDAASKQTSPKNIPTKPPRRSRSQTHPVFCQEDGSVSGQSSPGQSTPEMGVQLKRTAPKPPVFSKEDTMPRMPPPLPPTEESRRLSKDLQEGILRYHCASAAANSPKGKNDSNINLQKASAQAKTVKQEAKSIPETGSPKGRKNSSSTFLADGDKSKEGSSAEDGSSARESKSKVPSSSLLVSPEKGRSAPQPMISPPKTHLLHHLGESSPSTSESRQKEKKTLMFWKKRRRKDEGGSPEREYNTDMVAQWLEKLRQSTPPTQRRSWERMEVINAYKGQQTAVIGYQDQQNTPGIPDPASAKRRAPKPPTDSGDAKPLKKASGDAKPLKESKGDVKQQKETGDSTSLQPKSDDKASCMDAVKEESEESFKAKTTGAKEPCPIIPPPRTKSQQRRRRSNTVHGIPEYVNIAYLQQNKSPPSKPHRRARGTRSLTTGFENIPSATKRLAPKNPEEDSERKLSVSTLTSSASDQDVSSSSQGPRDSQDPRTPLKSAMRKGSPKRGAEKTRGSDKPPRRPVRVISSEGEPSDDGNRSGLPKSGYVNLEVKQVDLSDSHEKGATTSPSPQCLEADLVLAQVKAMQCRVLVGAGELYPSPSLEKSAFQDKTWEDFVLHERTLMFSDEKTFCFRAQLEGVTQDLCLMVFLHENKLDQVFEASRELESFPAHPNMLNVVHTFKATLPVYLFNNNQDEASQSNCSSSPSSQSEAVVVVVSQILTSTATIFLEESSNTDSCHEQYEESMWCMLLQVCRGVAHAQQHEPERSLEGLKQESLLRVGLALSGVWLFNPLVVTTLSTPPSTGRRDSVVSHLTDKCCEFDLGILIYELLGQPNPFAVRTSLMSRNYTPDDLPALPRTTPYSAKLSTLVRECLRRCPEVRITMRDALWMINALTFCPYLVSDDKKTDCLDIPQLNQLIVMKQTELVCSLAARRTSSPSDVDIWEKLEFLFWGEVKGSMLEKALNILKG